MSHLSGVSAVLCMIVCAVAATGTADVVPAIGAFDDLSPTLAGFRIKGETLAWVFSTTRELEVKALGFIDIGGRGLCETHKLGLWNAEGELLASTVLPPSIPGSYSDGDPVPVVDPAFEEQFPLVGNYRYADIDPIRIAPGQVYIIGATVPMTTQIPLAIGIHIRFDFYNVWNVRELSGDIEILDFREGIPPTGSPGNTLVFPEEPLRTFSYPPVPDGVEVMPVPPGFFGANFLYEPVPEPASVLYLMCASATMLAKRRRRR